MSFDAFKDVNIIVVGGVGFVGSNLCQRSLQSAPRDPRLRYLLRKP